mmetsp:Transcript_585/g.1019  ORF Transcript_585/g.1019 Transcript_585/m.1019 type:complete len:226 (-) Transcript_585:443-1120(-)
MHIGLLALFQRSLRWLSLHATSLVGKPLRPRRHKLGVARQRPDHTLRNVPLLCQCCCCLLGRISSCEFRCRADTAARLLCRWSLYFFLLIPFKPCGVQLIFGLLPTVLLFHVVPLAVLVCRLLLRLLLHFLPGVFLLGSASVVPLSFVLVLGILVFHLTQHAGHVGSLNRSLDVPGWIIDVRSSLLQSPQDGHGLKKAKAIQGPNHLINIYFPRETSKLIQPCKS